MSMLCSCETAAYKLHGGGVAIPQWYLEDDSTEVSEVVKTKLKIFVRSGAEDSHWQLRQGGCDRHP